MVKLMFILLSTVITRNRNYVHTSNLIVYIRLLVFDEKDKRLFCMTRIALNCI